MRTPAVRRISECFVKPHRETEESNEICYLSPWDVILLSYHYIQKGLLFKKPVDEQDFIENLLEKLKTSLSLALSHFYPLAGRLVTHKTQDPPSYSFFVDCKNSSGARFIYASLDMTISHILSPVYVPPIVHSFFDHHKAVNHDGHTMPLLSVQVTELVDAVFIGCSMNHSIGDGTSYWNFFNTWSEIFQAQSQIQGHEYDVPISRPPIHNRWFPNDCRSPINLPFQHHDEFICNFEAPLLRERIFHFSAECIARLKAKANSECNTTKISSLQSLSALVWRSITRARSVPFDEKTSCKMAINNRSRMEPPVPEEYFGNLVQVVGAESTTRELLENDLGWAAWKLHLAVTSHNDKVVQESVQGWLQSPVIPQIHRLFDPYSVLMGSSPRFNKYGSEFGMGRALAIRSGYANKFDGKVTSYPGHEGGGSMDLEVCLSPQNMTALESDQEFMDVVRCPVPCSS
ncbi:hypothetical protein VNO78_00529 [Psophocarpus tetragonolobus]|uniref:Acetyltransferase n=1 Tax=Psophocarpus tetragonolobus TaxID=3891 RepID=A0AAN9SYK1_PSOTE